MADYTATESGNWSTLTWDGDGGPPANGDTADTGAFDVNVDVNTTVGGSPAATGTDAITVSSGGSLTIATDVTLTVRGDLTATDGTTVSMGPGSTINMDSTQAGTPATADYQIKLGTSNYNNALLECLGTAAKPCTVKGDASGGGANIEADTISGAIQAAYTTFQKMTGDGTYGVYVIAFDEVSGFNSSFQHCRFDDCKEVAIRRIAGAPSDGEVVLEDTVFVNSAGTDALAFLEDGAFTSVSINRCYFDKNVDLNLATNFTIQNTTFAEAVSPDGGEWTAFANNLVHKTSDTRKSAYGDVTNCYYLIDSASASNPRHIDQKVAGATISGNLFQLKSSTAGGGDCIYQSAAIGGAGSVLNNIVLPNSDGSDLGPLLTLRGGVADTWTVEHNTMADNGIRVGEGYAGHAGMLASYKSNITWHATSGTYHIEDMTGTTQNLITSANADYNCSLNLTAGSNLKGYHNLDFSSGSPGANDFVDVDPGFVDSTRDLAAWDTALGGAGTVANALAELAKVDNIAGDYDSNYTVAAAVSWIKLGFAPTQVTLENAGHDSVTVGAVSGSTPATGSGYSPFLGPILGI